MREERRRVEREGEWGSGVKGDGGVEVVAELEGKCDGIGMGCKEVEMGR